MTAEACPLTPEEIRSWREEHLPYRLRHVDGLRWWLERLQAGKPPTVTVDGVVVHHKVLTNAVADAGLAACRALAELLGLATRRPRRRGDPAPLEGRGAPSWPGNDVTAEDLGARRVSPDEMNGFDRDALEYVLGMANRGVAHLAVGPPAEDVDWGIRTCDLLTRLVLKHVYEGHAAPDVRFLGRDVDDALDAQERAAMERQMEINLQRLRPGARLTQGNAEPPPLKPPKGLD